MKKLTASERYFNERVKALQDDEIRRHTKTHPHKSREEALECLRRGFIRYWRKEK